MSYKVRTGNKNELEIAVSWAAREGWNPGLHDVESFFATDPHGYFVGFLDNEPIASLSAVSYGPDFGFLGFYIVKPEHRGKGYGWKLWQEALKHLPTQNIGLDGVVAQQENYKKSGFKLAYRNIRYEGKGKKLKKEIASEFIVPLSTISLKLVLDYDRQVFPADRQTFLQFWFRQPESLALGYRKDGKLLGYGMVRKCQAGYKVGPLFADDEKIADELFQRFRSFVGESKIYLDVPEMNKPAVKLAERYNMKPMFETARMYTKTPPDIDLKKIFGVTTFELG